MTYAETVPGATDHMRSGDSATDRPGRRVPRRLLVWRSPDGQPRWARPVLLGIAALAAVLYAWNIRDSGYALFYSVAAKSMSVSWKAFFYGALDPGATVTIDKLAGSFIPQALSARIFGYHAWSLTLPQVIEGVISVLAMYRIGRRWLGPVVGLGAAGLFALTPITASMFGHPMEDGLLTMCLVLAADAFTRAMLEGRLRSLVWAGVWVGLGFQAKMLQAWMVLPAMAITYLMVAPGGWRRRLGQLSVAGLVLVAVSLSWILLYTATPAADRPYVDGSTNNSAFSMVFGYNGLDRFGISIPGSVQSMFTSSTTNEGNQAGPPGGGRGPGGGGTQWGKLLTGRYAVQIGWLYPLALLSLIFGLVSRGRRPRTDPIRAGFVLWGLWLVTFAVVFSRIMIPHTAYLASLAPPLAALSAGGIVLFARAYRNSWLFWVLPVALVAEVAWTLSLARQYRTFLPGLSVVVVAAAALALVVLVLARLTGRVGRTGLVAGLAAGVTAMVVMPGAWAVSVLDPQYGGSAFDASAGPATGQGGRFGNGPANFPGGNNLAERARAESPFPGGGGPTGPRGNGGPGGAGGPGGFGGGTGTTLTASQRRLYDYLSAHRSGARFIAATQGWNEAAPYITATGQAFLPMGGFSGSVPAPTLRRVQALVAQGQLHFFLIGAAGGGGFAGPGGGGGAGSELSKISAWVQSTCPAVPASEYGGDATGDQSGGFGQNQLYRCGG